MSLQCAPCLSDLALVREAVTSVGGTATCIAHAVLLRHPSDDPQRRRRRLAELRTLAEQRVVDATGTEKDRLELLVQEYAVAEAMDLGAPDRTGPGRSAERGRRGRGERVERRPGEPREPREPRESRHERGRRGHGAPVEGAPVEGASTEGASTEGAPGPVDSAPAENAPVSGSPNEAEIAAPVIESVIATESSPGESAPQTDAAPEAPTTPVPEAAVAPEPSAAEPARNDSAFSTPDPDAG